MYVYRFNNSDDLRETVASLRVAATHLDAYANDLNMSVGVTANGELQRLAKHATARAETSRRIANDIELVTD